MFQALDAGTAAVLPEGLRSELEQLEESGGVRHLNDLKEQIQVRLPRGALLHLHTQVYKGLMKMK